jgi:hypothetical protein
MRRRIVVSLTLMSLAIAAIVVAGVGPPHLDAIWADGTLYATVGTPSKLPNKGNFDGLYAISGLEGQRPVSESKPGDMDYNGGRWQVYNLEWTAEGIAAHDANSDGMVDPGMELTSWEDVEYHMNTLGHLTSTGMGDRFVCPLIKK